MAFLELTEFFSGESILLNVDKIVKINKNYNFDQATDIICNVTCLTVKESYEEIKDTLDYYLLRFRD